MSTRIDHFMYAFPSLEAGTAWAESTFGVTPAYGGEHVGLGTRNTLLSLGSTYLEIIVPDPGQSLAGTCGEQLSTLADGGLVPWAAEGSLTDIAQTLQALHVKTVGPTRTERNTAEGELLIWELLFPTGSPFGGRMPFFIDWLACTNPRLTTPAGGTFERLTISTPDAKHLSEIFRSLDLELAVTEGEPNLTVTVSTARGLVELTGTPETNALWRR